MTSEKNSLLDLLGRIAALTASFSLAASLIYDWGFFSGIGLKFRDLPSSLADHARSVLDWIPDVLPVALTWGVYHFFVRGLKGDVVVEKKTSSTTPEVAKSTWRSDPWFLVAVAMALFPAIAFIALGDAYFDGVEFAGWFAWAWFAVWFLQIPRYKRSLSVAEKLALVFVPILAIKLWTYGKNESMTLYATAPRTTLIYAGTSQPTPVTVFRYFDKGVLLREANGPVEFRPWSSIDRVETTGIYLPYKGIICLWFHRHCGTGGQANSVTRSAIGSMPPTSGIESGSERPRGR